jgi:hypothetical protein
LVDEFDEFSLEFSLRPDDPYESLFEEELLFDEPYELSLSDERSLRPLDPKESLLLSEERSRSPEPYESLLEEEFSL